MFCFRVDNILSQNKLKQKMSDDTYAPWLILSKKGSDRRVIKNHMEPDIKGSYYS